MKTRWNFASLLLAFLLTTNADATIQLASCGVTGDFSSYSCPVAGEGFETTVVGISKASNSYSCYSKSGSSGIADKNTLQQRSCLPPVNPSSGLLSSMASKIAFEMSARSTNGNSVPASIYDLSGVNKIIEDDIANLSPSGTLTSGLTQTKMDSHSNYESTVPSILVGILTLDSQYFNHGANGITYIDSTGAVDLNPEYLRASHGGETKTLDTIKKIYSTVTGSHTETNSEMTLLNPMGFMDKQILGFYVYLVSNLIAGYMDIIYLIFMMGTMWAFGIYGYKKYLDKAMGTQEFNVNKMSYLMTASMGFAFFTAPVIHENVDTTGVMQRVIYNDGNGHNTGDYYGYSTMAQQTIRYAAQTGTYFANLESDYAMQAFYALIEFKEGMFENPKDTAARFAAKSDAIKKTVFETSMNAAYVSNICRPYFDVPSGFNFSAEAVKNMSLVMPENGKNVLAAKGLDGVNRISMQECMEAYKRTAAGAEAIATMKKSLINEMNDFSKTYAGKSINGDATYRAVVTDKEGMFVDFLNMMTWTQNTFGWLGSVTPHSAYMFFKYINVFEYSSDTNDMKTVYSDALDNQMEDVGTHESGLRKTGEAVEWAAQATVGDMVIGNSVWFMVPGFNGAYNFFENQLQKLSLKGQTGEVTDFGKNAANPITMITNLIGDKLKPAGKIVKYIGKMADKIGSLLSSSDSDDYSTLQYIIPVISFFLAMLVVTTMIATVSIMIVTIFVIFNAIMYFLELIVFFVSAPIIGIYATSIGKDSAQYMENFMKHLGMLLVTPLMIVTSSYLVLPITELFKGLFLALVTLTFRIFDKGDDFLNQDVPLTNVFDSTKKVIAMGAMQGTADIFASVSVIFIAYIIIFNFKDWFAKIIGLDSVAGVTKEAVSELKQNSNKYISPF